MHDYRKFKVSVNGRIGRTARLSERLRRYCTSNPASQATRRRATPTTSPTWPRSCRPCAMRREQRGHPRRLAYSSDFSQWLVNNIPTLASRLNGLSIGHRRLLAFLRRYSRVIDVNEVRLQAHRPVAVYADRPNLTGYVTRIVRSVISADACI